MNVLTTKEDVTHILDTQPRILDSTGKLMLVGDTYEMYAPIAKLAEASMGLVFDDEVNHSFVYTGLVDNMICADGVHYDPAILVTAIIGHDILAAAIGTEILCPSYIATKFIRPVTSV